MAKTDWEAEFTKLGAFWVHDGNPNRPYAQLKSGLISDGFFNCAMLVSEHPAVFAEAVRQLERKVGIIRPDQRRIRIIGAAKGAIALAYQLGVVTGQPHAYAEDHEDRFEFEERFASFFAPDEHFMVCEDTVTTGGTMEKLMQAAERISPQASFSHSILAVCNRSGLERVCGSYITALIHRPIRTWRRGENPHTTDGHERVEPVSGVKNNWSMLAQEYA